MKLIITLSSCFTPIKYTTNWVEKTFNAVIFKFVDMYSSSTYARVNFGHIACSTSSPSPGGGCFDTEDSDRFNQLLLIKIKVNAICNLVLVLHENASRRVKLCFFPLQSASSRPHYLSGRSKALIPSRGMLQTVENKFI